MGDQEGLAESWSCPARARRPRGPPPPTRARKTLRALSVRKDCGGLSSGGVERRGPGASVGHGEVCLASSTSDRCGVSHFNGEQRVTSDIYFEITGAD